MGNVSNPVEFWKILKNGHNTKSNLEIADVDKWTNYFKSRLHNNEQTNLKDLVWPENSPTEEHNFILNSPISHDEIKNSIKRLNGKSPGKDRILAEFYKTTCDISTPFLALFLTKF